MLANNTDALQMEGVMWYRTLYVSEKWDLYVWRVIIAPTVPDDANKCEVLPRDIMDLKESSQQELICEFWDGSAT